jgi:hypothetical protein
LPPTGAASTGEASRPGYTAAGERSAQAIREDHQAWADQQTLTSSCAFCDWKHEGPALEVRELALKHRQDEHPEACIRRARPRGSRITKRKLRSAGEEAQIKIDAAEANRIRAEREQDQMLATIERGRERNRAALAALDGQTV